MSEQHPSERIVWLDDDGVPRTEREEDLAEPAPPRRRRLRIAMMGVAVAAVGAAIVVVLATRDDSTPSAASTSSATPSIPVFDELPSSQRTFALEPRSLAVPDLPTKASAAMTRAVRERLPGAKAEAPIAIFDDHTGVAYEYTFATSSRRVTITVAKGPGGSTSVTNPSDYQTVIDSSLGKYRVRVDLRRRDGVPLTGSDLKAASALASDARLIR